MARRSFDVFDLIELFTHWHAGRSQRQLAESLGIDRKTIAKYLAPAIAESLTPGGEQVTELVWAAHIARWFPEIADPGLRATTWPGIEMHRDRIRDWLKAEVSAATVAQRLRDDHGVAASESSVRRWISANLSEEAAREKVTVARGPVPPGSEAQIDYGRLGMWFDPVSGRRVAVWAFVMVLAYSRHIFVQPVLKMHQSSWCTSHVAAFEFFGGVPARLVPDNLKAGVARPDLYDPKINEAYAELGAHYRCLIDPARAGNRKTNHASSGPCNTFGTRFGGAGSSTRWSRCRPPPWCGAVRSPVSASPGRWTDKSPGSCSPPSNDMRCCRCLRTYSSLAVWSTGKVATDCHVTVGKALYSVQWRLMGQQVHARTCGDIVQIVRGGDVVATHVTHHGGRATDFEHYPPEKIAFTMRNPTWCRRSAAEVGPACTQVIAEFMEVNAIHRLRSAQGVLAFRKTVGDPRLEAACARAIAVGDPSYRTIKGILAAGTELDGITEPAPPQARAHLRGPEAFDTSTGETA